MTIIVAAIVLILWTGYRLMFPENLALDEFVLKPLIWLTPVFLAVFFFERDKISSLGYHLKNLPKNILLGLGIGLLFSVERLLVKHFEFNFSMLYVATALFTAITEETFFRGYLLNRWQKKFKNPIIPLTLNALFFTFTHLPLAIFQLHYYGLDLLAYLFSNFVTGCVNIFLFHQTKSIFPSIANHFVWNTFSGLFR